MQLPASVSSAFPSAFDLVGGECFAGPTDGRPSNELARSDGASDAFDELLKDELGEAQALAFLGFNPVATPVPAPVAPPADAESSSSVDLGSVETSPSSAGTTDASTNLRQLVLGRLRPPVSNELKSAITPAFGLETHSTETSVQSAISTSSEMATAGVDRPNTTSIVTPSTDVNGVADRSDEPLTSAAAREVHAESPRSPLATDEVAEPVILSLNEHRQQIANSAADGRPPSRREGEALDESARDQVLPFTPIVGNSGIGQTDTIAASANESQPVASLVAGVSDQPPASQNEGIPAALPQSEQLEDIADGDASSTAEFNADATLDTGDATQMTVEAAMVSGAVVSSNAPPASREDSSANRIKTPTGEVERRGPGVRTPQTRAADESPPTASDAVAEENAAPALRSSRPRPEVIAAAQHVNDSQIADDLGSSTQVSAATASSDNASQAESAATEPSVVQQVSQAVETWRDALQEQGSARFATWLTPPDLGHVWVELTRSGEGITARLKASDDSVQSLLESQEPELRQALNDSGITVADLDLSGRATGDFTSDQRHQQLDRQDDAETSALQLPGRVQRVSSPKRASAIDVRA